MTKRQITPYKGGRSARLEVRIKPDIKATLERIAQEQEMTVADLIEFATVMLSNDLPPRKE